MKVPESVSSRVRSKAVHRLCRSSSHWTTRLALTVESFGRYLPVGFPEVLLTIYSFQARGLLQNKSYGTGTTSLSPYSNELEVPDIKYVGTKIIHHIDRTSRRTYESLGDLPWSCACVCGMDRVG